MTPLREAYAAVYASAPWHTKVLTIANADRLAAFGLWTAILVHCQVQRNDGRMARAELVRVFPCADQDRERLATALIAVGLLEADGDALQVHDFSDYNRTRAEIDDAYERMVKGGRKGGMRSGESRRTLGTKGGVEGSQEKKGAEKRRGEDEPSSAESVSACSKCGSIEVLTEAGLCWPCTSAIGDSDV